MPIVVTQASDVTVLLTCFWSFIVQVQLLLILHEPEEMFHVWRFEMNSRIAKLIKVLWRSFIYSKVAR